MQAALTLGALAAGLAATPHCAAMCGAPCAALTGGQPRASGAFQLGRLAGYAAGGALVAAGVGTLEHWSAAAPALRPLWMLLQLGFLGLGLWWLVTGRRPGGRPLAGPVPVRFVRRAPRAARAGAAGLAWVAWPCGALQGAMLLAALADDAFGGALVMSAFALASMPALVAGPWLWGRLRGLGGTAVLTGGQAWAQRVAGGALVLTTGWALTHGLWARLLAWCAA